MGTSTAAVVFASESAARIPKMERTDDFLAPVTVHLLRSLSAATRMPRASPLDCTRVKRSSCIARLTSLHRIERRALKTLADVGSPAELIDLDRYPIGTVDAGSVAAPLRASLAERGVALLPGFLGPEAVAAFAAETQHLVPRAHREDCWGTPYLGLPEESYPDGHPRRTTVQSITWVIAYDLIPTDSLVRALYEWDPLKDFLAEVIGRGPLCRFADPLGAVNLTSMVAGDVQGWHFDSTDFVVSIGIQSSRSGGDFECAKAIRSAADENYDAVARVLRGDGAELVEILPLTPGTLMVFEGRNSLHRVSPVVGDVPRAVALFAYDTKPDTNSSDLLKLVRYGRTEAIAPEPWGAR
jgi:hypothetical protein